MKRADLFIETIRHLKRQGPSVRVSDEEGRVECFYRGNSDTRCAVGYWIPDDLYTVIIEGESLTNLLRSKWIEELKGGGYTELAEYLETEVRHHYQILRRLQEVHDYSTSEDGTKFDMGIFKKEALKAAEELGIDLDLVRMELA